jgi:uncharacterized protein (DUF2141 family)
MLNDRPRHALGSWFSPLALVVALLGSTVAHADEPAPSTNVIEFLMHVRNQKGVVRCGLFQKAGWLEKVVQPALAPVAGSTALCVFKGIRPGVYGLSAFHDENRNGKLDTNLLGMPVEDYCASRNARGTFGPPSFEDAKFKYTGGTKRLVAQMK